MLAMVLRILMLVGLVWITRLDVALFTLRWLTASRSRISC